MMEELWLSWSHLGVDDSTKMTNITKLVHIEKEHHHDVISETRQKLKVMQAQIDSEYFYFKDVLSTSSLSPSTRQQMEECRVTDNKQARCMRICNACNVHRYTGGISRGRQIADWTVNNIDSSGFKGVKVFSLMFLFEILFGMPLCINVF